MIHFKVLSLNSNGRLASVYDFSRTRLQGRSLPEKVVSESTRLVSLLQTQIVLAGCMATSRFHDRTPNGFSLVRLHFAWIRLLSGRRLAETLYRRALLVKCPGLFQLDLR